MGAPKRICQRLPKAFRMGSLLESHPVGFLTGLPLSASVFPVGTLVTNGKLSSILLRKQFGQNVPKIPCWTTQWVLNQVVSAPSVAMLADL